MYIQITFNTLGHTFTFSELLLFLLLAFNSTSPPESLPSLFSHTHTHTHTFRNLRPGRQSSFINFWVWVQYSVFLDSHLRVIINTGMLAEHPDLQAQICRHHCEGRAGRTPEQPSSRQPNKCNGAGNANNERAALPPRCAHIQIPCIAPHLNARDIYVGIFSFSAHTQIGFRLEEKGFNFREPD